MKCIKILSRAIFLWGVPFFVFAANPGDVVITEFAYDLKGADSGHEWVEIYNTASSSIDLTGWKFNDVSNHGLNIPPKNGGQGSIILSAGSYAIIADDAVMFLADHPGFTETVIDTVMSLNNTQATLLLSDNTNTAIDTVSYTKDWGAVGNGKTLERTDTVFPTDVTHWRESTQDGGTPGLYNSATTQNSSNDTSLQNATSTTALLNTQQTSTTISSVNPLQADARENIVGRANEPILFSGFGTGGGGGVLSFTWNFGDGTNEKKPELLHIYEFPGTYIATLTVSNGTQINEDQIEVRIFPDSVTISEFIPNSANGANEWIELMNSANYTVDISGWGLGTKKEKPTFLLPNNTFLPHNGYLVFSNNITKISLNNTKGSLYLFYPNGQVAGEVTYENPKQGFSAASRNGTQFYWTKEQTPGMKNVFIETTASKNTNTVVSVQEDNTIGKITTHISAPFAVYEKQNGIKSFLGKPAYAAVISEDMPFTEATSLNNNMSASAFNAFRSAYVFLFLGIIAGIGSVVFYIKKNKGV